MANKNNTKAKQKKSKKRKKTGLIVGFLLILIIGTLSILSYSALNLYKNGGVALENNGGYFEIAQGQNLKAISNNLKRYGIIKSPLFFRIKCEKLGIDKNFKTGEFEIPENSNFEQIVAILQKSNADNKNEIKFLIKEGQTQEEIGKNLEKEGIISYFDFMNACNNSNFDYEFLKEMPVSKERESRLEGYLYPDTYFIKIGESAESIINKFLKRFNELYTEDLKKITKEKGLTIDKVVTMASVIEKEVKYAPERKIVASVIFNRLAKNMPLQMDATVLYAKKEHSDRTLIEDTKINSPYNTYQINGLPIGPISNPRIECIEAVLKSEDTSYLYYVVKDEQTGQHFFTEDYNEFLNAKKKYLKKFDK